MFGFLFGKTVEKVDLSEIAEVLDRRHYQFDIVDKEKNVIRINEKYISDDRKVRNFLYLTFLGERVQFKDSIGNIMGIVPMDRMYPAMKNILNLV